MVPKDVASEIRGSGGWSFNMLWYVNIMAWHYWFYSTQVNIKLFTVPKHRYLRAQNLIIDLVQKISDAKEGKEVGNKRILISRSFNYSIEEFELLGGSYRIHQSDYARVQEKNHIHWTNRSSAFELPIVLTTVIVVPSSFFLWFFFFFVCVWFPNTYQGHDIWHTAGLEIKDSHF